MSPPNPVLPLVDPVTCDPQGRETSRNPTADPLSGSASPVELESWLKSILTPSSKKEDLGQFGDYRIQGVLGAGGMGIVLKAWEQKLERPVALKLILPKSGGTCEAEERFLREARAAAAVSHQRIVPVFAVGEVNKVPFLAMPLLAGQSLGTLLKARKQLPIADAMRYTREAAEGLAAAHSRGLVHRDIKPDNIWIEQTDHGTQVRLLDFGVARGGRAAAVTVEGGIVGTPNYMAPEQAAGKEPHPKADLFSLGCVLYEMLVGKKAFEGPDLMSALRQIANHTPPPLATLDAAIPANLSTLVERLLEKDPAKRFDSAEVLARSLNAIEKGPSTTLPTVLDPASQVSERSWTSFLWVGAIPMIALLAVVIAVAFWLRPIPSPTGSEVPDLNKTDLTGPLGVKSFRINHFEKIGANEARAKGYLGEQSFAANTGDQVTIDVELTHPAYAYLVAFRPDGVMELIWPDSEDEQPEKRSHIRYPSSDNLDKHYGLKEGTGLWVFAVAASDEPLPPFRTWAEEKPKIWARVPAQAGIVLNHDGYWIETVTAGGKTRAKGEDALDIAKPFAEVMKYLKGKSQSTFAAGLGIPVGP